MSAQSCQGSDFKLNVPSWRLPTAPPSKPFPVQRLSPPEWMSHGRPDYFPNLPPQMALPGFGGIWLILPPTPPNTHSPTSDGGFQGNVRDRRRDAATVVTTVTQNSLATLFTPGPALSGSHSPLPSVPSTLLFLFSSAAHWERIWWWRRSVEPFFDSMGGNDATARVFSFPNVLFVLQNFHIPTMFLLQI